MCRFSSEIVDLDGRFQLTVKSFPILNLKCVYGHVSFPSDLLERRLVALPDYNTHHVKFVGVKSPCFLDVKSSAVFNVSICMFCLTYRWANVFKDCLF